MPGVYLANQMVEEMPHTVITYDQGAKWQPLKAPALDANNEPTNCELVC